MKALAIVMALLGLLGTITSNTLSAQSTDKYTVKVPGGLAFSEFKGFEGWQVVSTSDDNGAFAAILGNPKMIEAYKAGIPANGKPVPDGATLAKIHWKPTKMAVFPSARVPGELVNVDFMTKDSKRFKDSGGWGWGAFEHNAKTGVWTPADSTATPPQGHDAKCGFACHTVVKNRDFVFTDYAAR